MLTLKITRPLCVRLSYSAGALLLISQYGYGVVQKSVNGLGIPSGVSCGTDSVKAPEARCPFQRVTISVRSVWSADDGGKKEAERSASNVAAKSGGVTSETNHGIDFGLCGSERQETCVLEKRNGTCWKTTWDT